MGVDDTLLNEIVRRILSVAQPDKVILFGSAATGQMTKDSDIDLLVIEPAPADTRAEGLRIDESLRGLGYPFDVFVMDTERFEESKNIFGGLAYPAQKYGRAIYGSLRKSSATLFSNGSQKPIATTSRLSNFSRVPTYSAR